MHDVLREVPRRVELLQERVGVAGGARDRGLLEGGAALEDAGDLGGELAVAGLLVVKVL